MLKTGPFRVNNASPELISENPFILNRDQTATQIAAQLLLVAGVRVAVQKSRKRLGTARGVPLLSTRQIVDRRQWCTRRRHRWNCLSMISCNDFAQVHIRP